MRKNQYVEEEFEYLRREDGDGGALYGLMNKE